MRRATTALVGVTLLIAGCAPTQSPETGTDAARPDDARETSDATTQPSSASRGMGTATCPPVLEPDDPDPYEGRAHPRLRGGWYAEAFEAARTRFGDRFGGSYRDQDAGEAVVVLVGDEPGDVLDELRERAPDDRAERLTCRHGTVAKHELDEVAEFAKEIGETADDPSTAVVDEVRNRVEMRVEAGDPDLVRDQVEQELGAQAAAAIDVEVPDCARTGEPPEDATRLPGRGSNCSAMEALLTDDGELMGDAATGCLEVADTPLAFPLGWTITVSGTVHDQLGRPVADLGDQVSVGGGHVPVEDDGGCGFEEAFMVGEFRRANR